MNKSDIRLCVKLAELERSRAFAIQVWMIERSADVMIDTWAEMYVAALGQSVVKETV